MKLWGLFLLAAGIVAAQGDLVRQSRQALARAKQTATEAGAACRANEYEKCEALLTEAQAAIQKARDSLDKTGINPRTNPRHYKDAEIRTRETLKLLQALAPFIHPEDRAHYDAVVKRISEINDYLLSAIMTKKRK